jgi:threonine aldolase
MHFASDNTAGIAPAILDAIARATGGYAHGYGSDAVTARVEARLAQVFEHEVAVFLVPTGTAANALALAQVSPPWGAVLCHVESHIAVDECGATEFFGGGLKLIGLPGEGGKIAPDTLEAALARGPWPRPRCRCPRRPKPAPSTGRRRSSVLPRSPTGTALRCTWTAPALPTRWCAPTRRRRS